MCRVKRLLVPMDFSPASDIAFNYALDLAAREGASIRLLHVIEHASFAAAYPEGIDVEALGLREQLVGEAQTKLDAAVKTCAAINVVATTRILVGPPVSCITREATECGSDLIVTGTHGRSAFAHLMLGSVVERVLRTAPCPVLTVRDSSRAADTIAADAVSRRQAVGAICSSSVR